MGPRGKSLRGPGCWQGAGSAAVGGGGHSLMALLTKTEIHRNSLRLFFYMGFLSSWPGGGGVVVREGQTCSSSNPGGELASRHSGHSGFANNLKKERKNPG